MFGAEKIADMFDQIHEDNQRWMRSGLQDWVNDQYQSDPEGWKYYGAAVTSGVVDALYTLPGTLGAGLVDTLRLGEGVKEGTPLGVAKDGLRVISVVGGSLRVLRLVAAEARLGGAMTCTLSSSAKAGVLSGNWFRRVMLFDHLAAAFGGRTAVLSPLFRGTSTPLELRFLFQMFNTRTTVVAVKNLKDVADLTRSARGPVVFGVRWAGPAGTPVGGHTMMAYRGLLGEIRFADQSGRTVRSVSALGPVQSVYHDAMIVHDAVMVKAMRWGAVGQFLATPLYDVSPAAMKSLEAAALKAVGRPPRQPPKPAAKSAPAVKSAPGLPPGAIVEEMTELSVCQPPRMIGEQTVQSCRFFYLYRVRPGDSVRGIAKKVYKDERYWSVIVGHNRDLTGPSYVIHPGQQLLLPSFDR